MPRNADGTPSLNLFGIKADDGWSGARATAGTVEFSGGVAAQRAAFRAYGSIQASVRILPTCCRSSPRYAQAVAAGDDLRRMSPPSGNPAMRPIRNTAIS
jgi:peptidoglycan hydrolase FlgJ